MRLANQAGRLVVVHGETAHDVQEASAGTFSSDPQEIYPRWREFQEWAAKAELGAGRALVPDDLGPPVPSPRQVFAVGLNYREHADEVGATHQSPVVFTKYVSSITGPYADIPHPGGNVDWEAELVVVIGEGGRDIAEDDAWSHVSGVTIGQDFSERITQHAGARPQFSLGKSFPGFAPIGPVVVTPDELADPDDLPLECLVNGQRVQRSRTSLMTFDVGRLIAHLSSITTLLPGDLVFTGTPAGVGSGMKPPRFLDVGDEVVTRIDGLGETRHRIVAREEQA